jgi:hypothetical protein
MPLLYTRNGQQKETLEQVSFPQTLSSDSPDGHRRIICTTTAKSSGSLVYFLLGLVLFAITTFIQMTETDRKYSESSTD